MIVPPGQASGLDMSMGGTKTLWVAFSGFIDFWRWTLRVTLELSMEVAG
jgi:hypothetical protein